MQPVLLMSLLPLISNDIVKNDNIIIDAKSGVSGAGKSLNSDLMFCEMANNFFPYKIGKHQHTPEINKAIYAYTHKKFNVRLTTHMLPIVQGMSMSIYADANADYSSDEQISSAIEDSF